MLRPMAVLASAAALLLSGVRGQSICDATTCLLLPNDICLRRNGCGPCVAPSQDLNAALDYTCYPLNNDDFCDKGVYCPTDPVRTTTPAPTTTRRSPTVPTATPPTTLPTTASPSALPTTTSPVPEPPAPPPPSTTPSASTSSSSTAYILVGAAVVTALVVAGCCVVRKLRRNNAHLKEDPLDENEVNSTMAMNDYVALKEQEQLAREASSHPQGAAASKERVLMTTSSSSLENEEADLWGNVNPHTSRTAVPPSFSHPNYLNQSS
ncbi:hypothetical protein H257_15475 [Aphanomyces astaci]|uniref:Uncharacterized protein n=1 Tax=Aphanomyces astaci TaxID=112090 RepID=W4FMH4_APHAT|nr:hypothetical protein H257_15475 [Aphanomyces astaci]ETV68670.1 hypothetical protein H257_15475 [Aphanomyces astaci]|eukprot:XP_009841895.1 hypothetical protein H257_15475 [Aphanomyces astaci]